MRSERIESGKVPEASFSPFSHCFLLFYFLLLTTQARVSGLISANGQGIVVFMHIRHLVYGCDGFN